MCMAIARNGGGFAFVVTDTRRTRHLPEGGETYQDVGERLVRAGGSAFAAGTGSGGWSSLAMACMGETAPGSIEEAAGAINGLVRAHSPRPWGARSLHASTHLAGVTAGQPWAGSVTFGPDGVMYTLPLPVGETCITFPGGTSEEEEDRIGGRIGAAFGAVPKSDLARQLNIVAQSFLYVATQTPKISTTLHVGIALAAGETVFAEVEAEELRAASPEAVLPMLRKAAEPAPATVTFNGNVPRKISRGSGGSASDHAAEDVFVSTVDRADVLKYTDETTVEALQPAEVGAEANPASLTGANCVVDDIAGNDDYTVTWTYNSHVTISFTIVIRYFREGVEVGSEETIATDGSETFQDTGAGDGVDDFHWATLQLYDGSGNAIGGAVETKHAKSML